MSPAATRVSSPAVACQAARACPSPRAARAAAACSRLGAGAGARPLGLAASRTVLSRTAARTVVVVRAEQGDDAPASNGRPPVRGKTRPQPKVTVSAPVVERAMSEAPPTPAAQNETAALLALTAVFLAIIVEGLLVASSGFMSEEWDGIVQNNVLPIFAPTLGLFLLGSSAYGVFKTYGAPK